MTEKKEFDVFLCHNSNDKDIVRLIAQKLEKHNVKVWFDEKNFIPGDTWKSKLYKMLDEVNTVVFFLGRNGVGPWQDAEINYLHNRYINSKKQSPRIIPILLDGGSINNLVPELNYLKEIQFMNLHNMDNYSEISKLIQVIFRIEQEEYNSSNEPKNKIEEIDDKNQFIGFFETSNVEKKRKDKSDKDIKFYNKKVDNLIEKIDQTINYTEDKVAHKIKIAFEKKKKEYEQSKIRIVEALNTFEKESSLIEKQLTLLLEHILTKIVPPLPTSLSLYWRISAIISGLIAALSFTSYLTRPASTTSKIVTSPPICNFSPGAPVTQERSIQAIQLYLNAKEVIFAPPYNRKTLARIATSEFYEKAISGINWLQQDGSYYRYNIQKIENVEEFASQDNKATIKVRITEDYTLYNSDGLIDKSSSDFKTYTVIYNMILIDRKLKISASKII